jgi:hypothetical protein
MQVDPVAADAHTVGKLFGTLQLGAHLGSDMLLED